MHLEMSIILFYFIKMVSDKTSNFCNTYFDKKFATSVDWFVKSFQRDMCIYWCVLTYFAICIHGWLGRYMKWLLYLDSYIRIFRFLESNPDQKYFEHCIQLPQFLRTPFWIFSFCIILDLKFAPLMYIKKKLNKLF